jgi:glycosyltransferase involved in cell wall biosynthesis
MSESWQRQVLMVIPSINGERELARMLPTLRVDPSNVFVLDQGSVDRTDAVCAEMGVEVIQLGRPHTYTQAGNIGARLAQERGCAYLCISNNDITFRTDVMREMWEEMERDPSLGIVAPSQVIVDEARGTRVLSTRTFWQLDKMEFHHDTRPMEHLAHRLEADFCELTCALIRMSAIAEIGFLDDKYEFYHEDADFGFRLRLASYGCAYLPASQIDHFSSSTFNRGSPSRKADFLRRNRAYFVSKHLGYRLRHTKEDRPVDYGPRAVDASLHPILRRYGLLDDSGPVLRSAPPVAEGADYLYVTLDAPAVPERRLTPLSRARAIFVASERLLPSLAATGMARTFHLPLGVDTDVFHPWIPAARIRDETTILTILDAGEQRSLRVILDAWRRYQAGARQAWLVIVGRGLRRGLGTPTATFATGEVEIARYAAEHIEVHEPTAPLTAKRRAALYRAADAVLLAACGEGAPLAALEAMACGRPCILGDYGLHGEIAAGNALTYGRDAEMPPGVEQWSPSIGGMVACLERLEALGTAEREALACEGVRWVRSRFTLRHTAMALYRALSQLQERDPTHLLSTMERQRPTKRSVAGIRLPDVTRLRLSVRVARLVGMVGHLASQFGSAWEEGGLRSAFRTTVRRVLSFVKRRSSRFDQPVRLSLDWVRLSTRDLLSLRKTLRKPLPRSTLLVGYIDGQLGLGQSLRGLALAMAQADIPFRIYPVGLGIEGRRSVPYMPERIDRTDVHAVNVIEVTADELPHVLQHAGRSCFNQSYNILRTYWELSRAPETWRPNLTRVHEIWVPTTFVAASFRTIFDGPITIVPPCVQLLTETLEDRAALGLEEGRYYFLFSFDYFSFPQRKNPMAVVRAFRDAFDGASAPVELIVKATGAPNAYPELRADLHAAAAYDGRITILDESISRRRMLSLIAATDCYVSLHRAEGFGFGMAEALSLGKPVIGTGYSGNAEFLTEETGYPIPYVLRPVAPDEYVHTNGQVWAEPDEAAAAAAMRRVVANPAEASARAEAGRRVVLHRYGPQNVGRLVAMRLGEIFAAQP